MVASNNRLATCFWVGIVVLSFDLLQPMFLHELDGTFAVPLWGLFYGVVVAQAALLSIWAAFSQWRLAWRVWICLGIGFLVTAAIARGSLDSMRMVPAAYLVGVTPLFLLRARRGIRLVSVVPFEIVGHRRPRFNLSDLFSAVTLVAFSVGCTVASMSSSAGRDRILIDDLLTTIVKSSAVCLLIAFPVARIVALRPQVAIASSLTIYALLLTFALFLGVFFFNPWGVLLIYAPISSCVMFVCFVGASLGGTYGGVRGIERLGYQLICHDECQASQFNKESPG